MVNSKANMGNVSFDLKTKWKKIHIEIHSLICKQNGWFYSPMYIRVHHASNCKNNVMKARFHETMWQKRKNKQIWWETSHFVKIAKVKIGSSRYQWAEIWNVRYKKHLINCMIQLVWDKQLHELCTDTTNLELWAFFRRRGNGRGGGRGHISFHSKIGMVSRKQNQKEQRNCPRNWRSRTHRGRGSREEQAHSTHWKKLTLTLWIKHNIRFKENAKQKWKKPNDRTMVRSRFFSVWCHSFLLIEHNSSEKQPMEKKKVPQFDPNKQTARQGRIFVIVVAQI